MRGRSATGPRRSVGAARGSTPLAWTTLALLATLGGCGLLGSTYTADKPGQSGKAPVEVTADFEGNEGLGSRTLRKRIEDYLLDLSRDPTRESAVYDAALEVEDYYRSRGYPVAKVEYEYSPPAADAVWPEHVRVLFKVKEGPLVRVEMKIAGNVTYSTDEFLALWSRKSSGVFGLGEAIFVESQVRAFVEELRVFYRTQARLDAVVTGPSIDVDLEKGVARVEVKIAEGNVHTIRSSEVSATLRATLGSDLPAPPDGKPFAQNEMQAYRHALTTALRKKGFPNPRIEIRAEPIEGSPFARRLVVEGEPGKLATVASVGVAGNVKTLDGVILGKLGLEPGDRYDGTKVDEAQRRLYTTGLFRKVEIQEKPVEGDPSRLGLNIQVEEDDSRSIELLGGYGSYERLRGGLRLEDRNILGTGRGLALDNKVSMKGYSTALTLTDADFLATQSTLTVTGEYFRREEPAFTDEALGGTIALARPIVDKLTARVGWTYRDHADATAFTEQPKDQLVDYVEGKVFVELRHDRRDNVLFPKAGHAEFLSFERLSPSLGASVDLDRLSLKFSQHFGLSEQLQLVLRTEQSALWPHGGSARVPLQERWFNGGESSVRSFHESELGPKDADGVPIGGEYRNLFGAEVRFPIWQTLEGSFFADAGNVGSNVQDFSFKDMGYALGAGLRLLLPIGPVRLDAAWNPDQKPEDDAVVVHFTVGYAF